MPMSGRDYENTFDKGYEQLMTKFGKCKVNNSAKKIIP